MPEVSRDQVLRKLECVSDPADGQNIVSAGRITGISIQGGRVNIALGPDKNHNAPDKILCEKIKTAAESLEGVSEALVIPTQEKAPPAPERAILPEVKHVIAVASGKGGVGKSTVAVNLACALARRGLKTGLLDADIYGPSVPRMMGVKDSKPEISPDRYFIPVEAHGVKTMSVGFLVPEEEAMVWRGPMIQKALFQMLRDVKWGALDVLVIDMPPGTGDAQLTLAQKAKLSGAVIVSTPQDIALIDARRGVEMFKKVNVPVLGVIENMSTHVCTNCGHEEHIFGHGGAKAEAEKLGVAFLGEIPLSLDLRIASDEGKPRQTPGVFDLISGKITSSVSAERA